MLQIDLQARPPRERYRWLISSVVPRPIAFVSTVSPKGVLNLAPFSYFSGLSATPPLITLGIGQRRTGGVKDTWGNVEATGELVVNVVPESLAEPMVACSGEWPPEESEFDISGLTPEPSVRVRPPRVAESPLAMECRLAQLIPVGDPPCALVLAEILLIHADPDILTEGLPDPRKLKPLARLGGNLYSSLGELIEIARPQS